MDFHERQGHIWREERQHLIKLLLKLLVGVIDAKLLKAVDVKRLKPRKKGGTWLKAKARWLR